MPAPRRNLPSRVDPPKIWSLDPLTGVGIGGAILFAGAMGGWLGAGLMTAISVVFVNMARQYANQLEYQRVQQENLQHFMVAGASPEDIALLKSGGDIADRELFDFLTALKETYGGESTKGSGRLSSDDQTDAVAPGIALTLSHDLGWWYAKLVLSGECGRQFLHGEYTQWKGRGKTPQAAIDAVIERCGASRQQRMIQDYAAKMVRKDN